VEYRKPAKRFPTTDWTRLSQEKHVGNLVHTEIVDYIARNYWSPIFLYLIRTGMSPNDAQDTLQEFFAFAIRTHLFEKADKTIGRFRYFLLASLKHFVANERRKESATKRRPALGFVQIEALIDDSYLTPSALTDANTPEAEFHQAWQREIIKNTLEAFETECTHTGKEAHLALFCSQIVAPELEGAQRPPLQQQAEQLGLTYKEAANRIVTAKRAFARLLATEVRSYAQTETSEKIEHAEILSLLALDNI
jgi:DNA-directed RNA polymerase specialized sigma24 family protein